MNNSSDQTGRVVGASVLIGLGILFFVMQSVDLNIDWDQLWPFFVIVPGAIFLVLALTGDSSRAGLIFPGLIITGTGAILFFQNATNSWESWTYIWAVYPALVGLGMMYVGWRTDKPALIRQGRAPLIVGVVMLAIFGGFFGLGGINWGQIWPVFLIIGGLFMLFGNRIFGFQDETPNYEKPKREE